MTRIVIVALMTCLAAGSVFAQSSQRENHLSYYESIEEHILEVQSEYLTRERELTEPLWVRTKSGDVRIVDGARLRTRLEGLVFVLQSMGLEAAALESLSPMMRIAAEFAGEEGRSDIAVSRVMETLQARSNAIRGEAIGDLNRLLETIRSESLRMNQTPPKVVETASESHLPEANTHGGKRCPNGGMIAGVGGDDVYRESFFDGNRSVTTVNYLLEIAPHPKHNGATFQHFFLDGEPFPDSSWGVNIATTKIVCK